MGLISHSRRGTGWPLARTSKLCEDSIKKQTDNPPHTHTHTKPYSYTREWKSLRKGMRDIG